MRISAFSAFIRVQNKSGLLSVKPQYLSFTRRCFFKNFYPPLPTPVWIRECLMKKLNCCVQGQGHSKMSKYHWIFVLITLLPNLVRWCIIMSQIVFHNDWFAVFKVKVTGKDYIIKIWPCISWTADRFSAKLGLMAHNYHKFIVSWKQWTALLWSGSQGRLKISANVHVDNIASTVESFVTKRGMVMHQYGPECHARRLVCSLRVQGHSEGSYSQIWLFLPYLLNFWSFCNHIWLDGTSS